MSIVAVLVLRALGEWREIEDRARPGSADVTVDELGGWPPRCVRGRRPGARRARDVDARSSTKSTRTDLVTGPRSRRRGAARRRHSRRARPDDAIVGEEGTAATGDGGRHLVSRSDRRHDELRPRPSAVGDIGRRRRRRGHARRRRVRAGARRAVHRRPRRGGDARRPTRSAAATATTSRWRSWRPGSATRRRSASSRAASSPRSSAQVRDIRRCGSAALDLCYVAAGRVDAYYEGGLNPWDVAAGELIAREAGCRIGRLRRRPADQRAARRRAGIVADRSRHPVDEPHD